MSIPRTLIRYLENVRVRSKLILSYCLGFVLPLVAVSTVTGMILSNQLRIADENQARAVVSVARSQLYESLETVDRLAGILAQDQFIETMLTDWTVDEIGHLLQYRLQLRYYLDSFVTAYPLVDTIEFYTTNDAIIQGGSVLSLSESVREKPWAKALSESNKGSVVVAHIDQSALPPRRRLSLVRNTGITSKTGRTIETILRIDLSISQISQMLVQSTPCGTTHLVDSRDRVITASVLRANGNDEFRSAQSVRGTPDTTFIVDAPLADRCVSAGLRIMGAFYSQSQTGFSRRLLILVVAMAVSSVLRARECSGRGHHRHHVLPSRSCCRCGQGGSAR